MSITDKNITASGMERFFRSDIKKAVSNCETALYFKIEIKLKLNYRFHSFVFFHYQLVINKDFP